MSFMKEFLYNLINLLHSSVHCYSLLKVSIPLLYNVTITYETAAGNNVTEVTRHHFQAYFAGQEMVIAGKSRDLRHPDDVRMCVWGYTIEGDMMICPPGPWPPVRPTRPTFEPETGIAAFVERMWAYLTIKQLLDDAVKSTNGTEKAELRAKALKLSLKVRNPDCLNLVTI